MKQKFHATVDPIHTERVNDYIHEAAKYTDQLVPDHKNHPHKWTRIYIEKMNDLLISAKLRYGKESFEE